MVKNEGVTDDGANLLQGSTIRKMAGRGALVIDRVERWVVEAQIVLNDPRGALTTSELMVILAITIPVMIVVYGSLGGSWQTEGNTVSNLVTNP